MKSNILSFFFLLLFVSTYAQRALIDSFKTELNKPGSNKAEIYVSIADEYRFISGDSAMYFADLAMKEAIKEDNEFVQAKVYVIQGTIEKNRGDYPKALELYLKGLEMAEKKGKDAQLTTVYNGIGIIYKRMKRWQEALEYYTKAHENAKTYNQSVPASYTANNIGTIYLEWLNFDSVYKYYDTAKYYAEQVNDTKALATVLSNYADLYRDQKQYDKAMDMQKRCLVYDKQNEYKYGMFMSYFQIAVLYGEQKIYTPAVKYFDSAEKIAIDEGFRREMVDLYGWRSNLEEWHDHYQESLQYFRKSKLLSDTLLDESTAKQVTEMQTKYETEKKEQQIVLQKIEISKRNYVIVGISALLLLSSLLGYSWYNRYKLKQRDKLQKEIIKQQELSTQAVIEAEERERKRIAGDLHDGVGQTMSAAKMNLSVISDDIPFKDQKQRLAFDKAMALVDEGCKEVRAVSHQIMPNALLKTGLGTAIGEFLNKIDSKVLKVNYYSEGLDERLPSNVETVLYRVVQECVNNVIKHAEANSMDMTLLKDEEGISVTIEDNGKGFDIATTKQKNGIGIQNLMTRIKYLKGYIEWDSSPGKGTVVTIQVPAETTT